jgi:hypothetical protein
LAAVWLPGCLFPRASGRRVPDHARARSHGHIQIPGGSINSPAGAFNARARPSAPTAPPPTTCTARHRAPAVNSSCIFVFLAHTITSTIPISGKKQDGKTGKKIVIVREHSQTARGAHVAASLTDTVNIPPIHHPGEGAFDFSRLCSAPPPVHLTPPSPPSSDLPRARARI